MQFDLWLKRTFFLAVIVFVTVLFLSACITIQKASARIDRLTAQAEALNQEVVKNQPVWVRLQKAGFTNYRFDVAKRQVIVNY